MDPSQPQQLLALTAQKTARWLYNHFKDQAAILDDHHWVALLSLAYNSRWNDDGPTLIGPNLTRFIQDANFEEAANEIRLRSAGGVRPNQQAGINARRVKESRMFLGDFVTASVN